MAGGPPMNVGAKPSQQYEHLLFGSVHENGVNSLLNRLRGLCESPECKFNDRIITAIISEKYKTQSNVVSLKATVRQSLDDPNAPIYLIYNGQLELGDGNRPTAVRTCVHVPCSGNLLSCLDEMGFTFHAELIVRGYLFQRGLMKITVSKFYQGLAACAGCPTLYTLAFGAFLCTGGCTSAVEQAAKSLKDKFNTASENGENSLSDSYLVELSSITPSGQDTIGTEMKMFAELLKPIVNLEKTDGR